MNSELIADLRECILGAQDSINSEWGDPSSPRGTGCESVTESLTELARRIGVTDG